MCFMSYMSTSWSAVFISTNKARICEGLANVWSIDGCFEECQEEDEALSLFVFYVTLSPCVVLVVCASDAVCDCQPLFFPSFPFSSDDTHFHLFPFRLKFLWLELMVLATAKSPSTWLKRNSKEEAVNEKWSWYRTGEVWESVTTLALHWFPSLKWIICIHSSLCWGSSLWLNQVLCYEMWAVNIWQVRPFSMQI